MNFKPVVRKGKFYPYGRWWGTLTKPRDIAVILAILIPFAAITPTLDVSFIGPFFDPPAPDAVWLLYATPPAKHLSLIHI